MSGVYIKNMPMPKRCLDCWLCYDGLDCVALDESLEVLEVVYDFDRCDSRSSNCPLVAVPDHGDLIDRDEAADDACLIWCGNSSGDDAAQEIIEHLREMKAIIPAERSEE